MLPLLVCLFLCLFIHLLFFFFEMKAFDATCAGLELFIFLLDSPEWSRHVSTHSTDLAVWKVCLLFWVFWQKKKMENEVEGSSDPHSGTLHQQAWSECPHSEPPLKRISLLCFWHYQNRELWTPSALNKCWFPMGTSETRNEQAIDVRFEEGNVQDEAGTT